jgi:hypothetical protein
MFSAAAFVIRSARPADEPALRRLAYLDSTDPLDGRILVGEIDQVPAAAISLDDERLVSDPFARQADTLRVHLRMRAAGIHASERMPSLADRVRAAMRGERPARPVRV